MKRYFVARDEDMPAIEEQIGNWHYIDLASHGPAGDRWNLICLVDGHVQPKAGWVAFPPIYDTRTRLAASAVPHEVLADVGLTGAEVALEAVMLLGEINPVMGL